MNAADMPPPTNDMATEALIKHWRARQGHHVHMVYATDSAIFTDSGFAGAVITSSPPPPGPQGLLPSLELQKFVLPSPPLVIVTAWQSLASQIADGSRKLDDLHWKEFEHLMAEILEKSGWSITPMGYTKDDGVDIIAARTVEPGIPIEMLVQCKRYKRTRRVGVEIVKELWATKWEKAVHQAMIAATSSFTQGARTKAKIWRMDLRDYDAILEWCKRIIM
jgi:HJR/Mrr/RecB family endonuclease